MASVKETIQTLDNAQVELIEPGRAANPDNVKRVEGIVKASDWEYLFRCAPGLYLQQLPESRG